MAPERQDLDAITYGDRAVEQPKTVVRDLASGPADFALVDRVTEDRLILAAGGPPAKQPAPAKQPQPVKKQVRRDCLPRSKAKYLGGTACVTVYQEGPDKYSFYLTNTTYDFVFVELEIDLLGVNAVSSRKAEIGGPGDPVPGPEIHRKLLRPRMNGELHFLDLTRENPRDSLFGYGGRPKLFTGNPDATPDNSLYALPYEKGKSFKCAQTFNGGATHQGRNAVDFEMNSALVTASRPGRVVEARSDSNIVGSKDPADKSKGNHVRVLHRDGTYAVYGHLEKDKVNVKPGDVVKVGDPIGISGNSGFSSGPHLHFDVSIVDSQGQPQTIDWKFKDKAGKPFVPEAGKTYKHE